MVCGGCFVGSQPSWPAIRRCADVAGTGSSAGTFSRRATEAALMALVTQYRGVHHQLVLDVPQAAALIVGLTKALAQQPYQSRVRCLLYALYSSLTLALLQCGRRNGCVRLMRSSSGAVEDRALTSRFASSELSGGPQAQRSYSVCAGHVPAEPRYRRAYAHDGAAAGVVSAAAPGAGGGVSGTHSGPAPGTAGDASIMDQPKT